VASGAPLSGAAVTILDANGAVVGQAVAQANGSYSVTLPLNAAPPFVLEAVNSDQTQTLFSIFPGLTSASTVNPLSNLVGATANITTLTNLLAALLSPTGDPSKLSGAIVADPRVLSPARVAAVEADVLKAIAPLSTALGVNSDPLTGAFAANGTGEDRLLDSLLISINPTGTSSNIQITVRQQYPSGTQPDSVTFTSRTTEIPPLAAVDPANLIPEGLSQEVNAWIAELNACYALPVTSRVSDGGNPDSVIIAPECLVLFYGNNPQNYLSNGGIVAPGEAFGGIFTASVTITFFAGTYQSTLSNGDYLVSYEYEYTDGAGNLNVVPDGNIVLRASGSSLQAIGNQYSYSGGVNALMVLREYLNKPADGFYRSGYNIYISNQLDGNGNPLFAQVVATSPTGTQYTLVPNIDFSYLCIVLADGLPSTSSLINIARGYIDPANTTDPSSLTPTTPYDPPPSTSLNLSAVDEAVEQSPDLGQWRFDYYLASAPSLLATTQYYYHFKRNLSVPEMRGAIFADFTPATQAMFIAESVRVGTYLNVPAPATGPLPLAWEVPTGAAVPTSLDDYGFIYVTPTQSFNDTINVSSSTRAKGIPCQTHSASDSHCTGGNFSSNTYIDQIQLDASDASGRDFATQNDFQDR
jgi:hypothetical protein